MTANDNDSVAGDAGDSVQGGAAAQATVTIPATPTQPAQDISADEHQFIVDFKAAGHDLSKLFGDEWAKLKGEGEKVEGEVKAKA